MIGELNNEKGSQEIDTGLELFYEPMTEVPLLG
jgi:hypothetical protein